MATVFMLSSLHARIIRTAISPLLATNIFLNNYEISNNGWPNSTASPFLTKIDVKDNNVEQAIRVLKRKLQKEGFFKGHC